MQTNQIQSLDELATQWDRIEERLKEAEFVIGEAVNPAINELRYAGRILVDAWHLALSDEEAETKLDEKITVAHQYLQNAKHDITDAVCLFFNKKIKTLVEKHRKKKLRQNYPNLDELLKAVDESNKIVTGSRKDRRKRKEEYERLETEYIPYMLSQFKELDVNEKLAEARERATKWWAAATFLFGATLGLVGFAGSIASIMGWWEVCSFENSIAEKALLCEPTPPVVSENPTFDR